MLKWCRKCVWAQDVNGRTYCPWPTGMCVKIPETMNEPDEFKLRKKICRTEYGLENEEEAHK